MNITLQFPKQCDKRIKLINQINWSLDPKLKYIDHFNIYLVLKENKTWITIDDKNHKDILNSQIVYVRGDRKISKKIISILENWSKKETGYLASFSLNNGVIKHIVIPLSLVKHYKCFLEWTYLNPNIGEFYRFCLLREISTTDLVDLEKLLDLQSETLKLQQQTKEKSTNVKVLEKLIFLQEYFATTRGVGHTKLLIDGLKNSNVPKKFLCENKPYGNVLIKNNNIKNCKLVSYHDLNRLSDHYKDPLIIDNSAIYAILKDSINTIKNLLKKNR